MQETKIELTIMVEHEPTAEMGGDKMSTTSHNANEL